MEKCMNCGHAKLKKGYLSGEKGLLYYKEGNPSFKSQLLGKRKGLYVKICTNCGFAAVFAKK
jgi:hypothetical protein